MAQRIESIDITRALAIICVVIGHAVSDETLCNIVIYSFHMPCFFVLAGIFLKPANENFLQSLKIFSHKKFLSLVVPFFIWGLIYAKFSFKSLAFISYGSWPCLRMAGTLSSLWFLPVLFLSLIFSYVALSLLRNCIKRDYLRGGICFMLLFFAGLFIPHNRLYGLPWGIDIALMAASFICLGYCGKVVLSKCTLKWWHSLVLLAIMLCVFVFSAPHSNSDVGYMLMANSEYGQPVLFLTNSVLGTAILLIVASLISRIPCKKRLLNF